jgi:hypothetical protein
MPSQQVTEMGIKTTRSFINTMLCGVGNFSLDLRHHCSINTSRKIKPLMGTSINPHFHRNHQGNALISHASISQI